MGNDSQMSKLISIANDEYAGFLLSGPPPWEEHRALPIGLDVRRRLENLEEDNERPLADFMWVTGSGAAGSRIFLASQRAWSLLLDGKFGVVEMASSGGPVGYRLVLVTALIDVIDFDRSVELLPGVLEGIHVHDVADVLVGESLFTLVGVEQIKLLCGDPWFERYRSEGMTGLSFEPASVG